MDIAHKLKQTATYWATTGGTSIEGASTWAAKVSRKCRWEDFAELFIDKKGQEATSRAKVYFDADISLEAYLFLGTSAETNPTLQVDAFEIRQIKRIPDIRNAKTLYVAFL